MMEQPHVKIIGTGGSASFSRPFGAILEPIGLLFECAPSTPSTIAEDGGRPPAMVYVSRACAEGCGGIEELAVWRRKLGLFPLTVVCSSKIAEAVRGYAHGAAWPFYGATRESMVTVVGIGSAQRLSRGLMVMVGETPDGCHPARLVIGEGETARTMHWGGLTREYGATPETFKLIDESSWPDLIVCWGRAWHGIAGVEGVGNIAVCDCEGQHADIIPADHNDVFAV